MFHRRYMAMPWEEPKLVEQATRLLDLYRSTCGCRGAVVSYARDLKGHPVPMRVGPDPWLDHLSVSRLQAARHLHGNPVPHDSAWWMPAYYRVANYLHGKFGCAAVVLDVDRHRSSDALIDTAVATAPLFTTAAKYGIAIYPFVSWGGAGLHPTIFGDRMPVPDARRLMYRLACAAGFRQEFERGLDATGSGFDKIVPNCDELGPTQIGGSEWLPFCGHATNRMLDRGAPIRLNPDGTLISMVEAPLMRLVPFLDGVVRHTPEQVADVLRRLAEDGHTEEPPTRRHARAADDDSDAPGTGSSPISGGTGAPRSRHRPRQSSGVDWHEFLTDAGIVFTVQDDDWAYLERCPFASHTGAYKFRIHRHSGWACCWVSHCEAADGVWPREWCAALDVPLPGHRRRCRRELRLVR